MDNNIKKENNIMANDTIISEAETMSKEELENVAGGACYAGADVIGGKAQEQAEGAAAGLGRPALRSGSATGGLGTFFG